jgi:hypothetical protein
MSDIVPRHKPDKYTWLKQYTPIDLLTIDEQITQMPVLIQECGECTSQAIEIREMAKSDLERIGAIVSNQLRSQLDGKGNPPSEQKIGSKLPAEAEYIEALASLSEARLDAGLWTSLMEALRVKSSSLKVSADLMVSGYITQSSILARRRSDLRERPR